jgi:hypothetical protein
VFIMQRVKANKHTTGICADRLVHYDEAGLLIRTSSGAARFPLPGQDTSEERRWTIGDAELLIRTLGVAAAIGGSRGTHFFRIEPTDATDLRDGDVVLVQAGQVIPSDGEILAGAACIDESAFTGQSSPALREAGGDCSRVVGGSNVLSGRIVVRIARCQD